MFDLVEGRSSPWSGGALSTGNIPESIGPYRVCRHLGSGGMGEVFDVVDPILDRHIAIKVLSRTRGDVDSRALMREAQILAQLNHPHIAKIFDYEEKPVPFIRMELVQGKSLAEVISDDAPLPLSRALDIAAQVADALEAAHGQGIIHRDLKPGNIMVGPRDQVVLLDFGIAKLMEQPDERGGRTSDSPANVLSSPRGTLAYMSPEQLDARSLSPASDLWALGIIVLQLLGSRPDPITSPRLNPWPPFSHRPSGASTALHQLLRRCLRSNPSSRPTAAEAREVFEKELLLTRVSRISVRPAPRRLSRPRLRIISAWVFSSLVIAIAWLVARQLPRKSEATTHLEMRWEGPSSRPVLYLADQRGDRLWETNSVAGEPIVLPHDAARPAPPFARLTSADGHDLVVFATSARTGNDHVYYFDTTTRAIVRTFGCDSPLPPEHEGSVWTCAWQREMRRSADGIPDAVAIGWFRDGVYASTTVEIRNAVGSRIAAVQHCGMLFAWGDGDLDQDGLSELLLYGVHQLDQDLPEYPASLSAPGVHPVAMALLEPPVFGQLYAPALWDEPAANVKGYLVIPPLRIDGDVREPQVEMVHWGTRQLQIQMKDGRIVTVGPGLNPTCVTVPSWSTWGSSLIETGEEVLWWGRGRTLTPISTPVGDCP
ncbi:MAG: serine/threonine protein kinase [Candidatus Eisenbacteria bacterium]|uniref:Serine/threonine protein kinase n=1 Tax=Eiseniibacteriota bacterium TaxID=2212470 RepID=A0A956RNJ2_UNCEI|nr:serine/threonine protein kinase [Candidatus Eisenbacteria bacterium]